MMIRAALGVVAAIAAMAAVIFITIKIPDRVWAPPIGLVLSCFAAACAGTFVGRTRWSGWIVVGLLFVLCMFAIFYFIFLDRNSVQTMIWWRVVGIPIAMLVACWLGTVLAGRFIPVAVQDDLEDLQRAFE